MISILPLACENLQSGFIGRSPGLAYCTAPVKGSGRPPVKGDDAFKSVPERIPLDPASSFLG